KGETLWALSKRYGVTVERLLELNPQIKNPNRIQVGQEVRVR
ncbi:MAG: LysM peptidoglycan-binding domain-containing protein, partial [Oscillospiraceae bacterium]|nr:LysM peptidoglycan-binding domain-containing protein [Oscillospiraceae bacterium]